VLVSNIGLTVFDKHQVNWLNRFHNLPSGERKTTKKNQLKDRDLMVFSIFAPYWSKSLQKLSLFS
jgi:hypothetical protein